jgi:hypothetical protein
MADGWKVARKARKMEGNTGRGGRKIAADKWQHNEHPWELEAADW